MAGVGIAGVPEAGLITLPLVLGAARLPESVVATVIPLLLPVDWLVGRCRAAVNVTSDMAVAVVLDRHGGRATHPPRSVVYRRRGDERLRHHDPDVTRRIGSVIGAARRWWCVGSARAGWGPWYKRCIT